MKKTFSISVLTVFLTVLMAPVLVGAVAGGVPDHCTISDIERVIGDSDLTCTPECYYEVNDHCGMCCLLNTLYNVTDWLFFALIAVAGILVVLGAMNMIMSQGDPEKVSTGRNYVVYAAIGLAIGFLARAIPNIARMIVGS